jgi:iron complex transport system substrate-binding protein
MSLAILARLFCCVKNLLSARMSKRARASIVGDAGSSEHRQECLCHFSEAILRRRRIFLCAAILCAMLGCAIHAAPGVLSGGVFIQSSATRNEPAKVITDETGRRVTIPADVKRVVTLAPNLTETIYALGLEERLAGDTHYCDTPPAAKLKPHVGGAQNPSMEAIVALHPDLVLATTSINRIETVDGLAKVGIAVYTTDPQTVRGMLESTARIAGLMGAEAQGSALVAKLQVRLDAVSARLADVPPVHALFVVWEDPLITIGQNTFIADAMRWAGVESVILSQQKWPHISFEEVVRLQPEYIVFASNHAGFGAEELGALRSREAWRQLRAVELGHIAVISEEINRPSPGLVDAIEQLAREVHPEVFRAAENGQVKIENGHSQRQMTRANFGVQELQGLKPRALEGSDMSRLKPRPTSLLTLQWAVEFGAPASMTSMRPDSPAEIVTGAKLRAAL